MVSIERVTSVVLSPTDIKNFECELGCSLPVDYVHFMLSWNGGLPSPSRFYVVQNGAKSSDRVMAFLCLDDYSEHYSIRDFIVIYKDRVPNAYLPIGCDPFGNLILLASVDRLGGGVFFWDHELEYLNEDDTDEYEQMSNPGKNIFTIAESFTVFISQLE